MGDRARWSSSTRSSRDWASARNNSRDRGASTSQRHHSRSRERKAELPRRRDREAIIRRRNTDRDKDREEYDRWKQEKYSERDKRDYERRKHEKNGDRDREEYERWRNGKNGDRDREDYERWKNGEDRSSGRSRASDGYERGTARPPRSELQRKRSKDERTERGSSPKRTRSASFWRSRSRSIKRGEAPWTKKIREREKSRSRGLESDLDALIREESSAKMKESIEVPASMCGRIIGKQGSCINQLQKDSGATIDLKKGDNVINISGTKEAVSRAMELLDGVLDEIRQERGPEPEAEEVTQTVDVLPSEIGKIIGRGGDTIQKLQNESSTRIKVNRDADPPTVTVRGPEDAVLRALELIGELVGEASGTQAPGEEQAVEEFLPVPSTMIGRLIGKAGQTVARLQDESGARIKFDKNESKVSVRGSQESVSKAADLISALLSEPVVEAAHAGNFSLHEGDFPEETIELPLLKAGLLIGSRGARINEIREQSGASIRLTKEAGRSLIRLSGAQEQIKSARDLITQVLSESPDVGAPLAAAKAGPKVLPPGPLAKAKAALPKPRGPVPPTAKQTGAKALVKPPIKASAKPLAANLPLKAANLPLKLPNSTAAKMKAKVPSMPVLPKAKWRARAPPKPSQAPRAPGDWADRDENDGEDDDDESRNPEVEEPEEPEEPVKERARAPPKPSQAPTF